MTKQQIETLKQTGIQVDRISLNDLMKLRAAGIPVTLSSPEIRTKRYSSGCRIATDGTVRPRSHQVYLDLVASLK